MKTFAKQVKNIHAIMLLQPRKNTSCSARSFQFSICSSTIIFISYYNPAGFVISCCCVHPPVHLASGQLLRLVAPATKIQRNQDWWEKDGTIPATALAAHRGFSRACFKQFDLHVELLFWHLFLFNTFNAIVCGCL